MPDRALVREEHFRALQFFDRIPVGHTGVVVTGSDFEPHLRRGEIAIVDTTDQSVEFGELYVLRMNLMSEPRPQRLEIVQLTRDNGGLWYAFSLPGIGDVVVQGRRVRYADGPLRSESWPAKCLGRVVGYMTPQWEGARR